MQNYYRKEYYMTDFLLSLYEEISMSRDKLIALSDLYKLGNMSDIGDCIDTLTENESKTILRMMIYGGWKEFWNEFEEKS